MSARFTGLIAAPPTPFDRDTALDLAPIERQAEKLTADGVSGVFIAGSTGEGASLTTQERRALAARWREVTRGGGLRLIVHVGHTALGDACALAAHAQEIEADAIAAYAPFYFRPQSVDALLDFLAPVAASAPGIPFFYYHIPALTGASLSMRAFLEQAPARIPTLAGLKYTHSDFFEYGRLLESFGEGYDLLWGTDELLLPARALGAPGAVGSTYNLAAPHYRRLLTAFDDGQMDEARRLSAIAMESVAALAAVGVIPAIKALLNLGPPRPPLKALAPEALETLKSLPFLALA